MNSVISFVRRYWFILFSFFVVSLWAFFIGVAPLWLDEGGSYYYISRGSIAQLLNILKTDTGLPLYYVLLFYWAKLFGYSEIGLRSLSYVFYVVDIALLYWLLRKMFDQHIARWSVVIMIFSSYMLNQAADARMYTFEVFLCLSAYLCLWYLSKTQVTSQQVSLVGFLVIINTLGLYTHYWYLIFFAVQFPIAVWLVCRWWLLVVYALPGLLFLPWFKIMQHHLQNSQYSSSWLTAPGLSTLIETAAVFMATKRSFGLILFIGLLVVAFVYRWSLQQVFYKYQQSVQVLLLWLCGVIGLGFILSQFKPVYYPIRYLIVAYPPFVGLCAVLFSRVQSRWQQSLIVFCLIISVLGTYVLQRVSPAKVSERALAQKIIPLIQPDMVIVFTGIARPTQEYYLRTLPNRCVSFPQEQARHPAWYSDTYYLLHPAELQQEITQLKKIPHLCVIYDTDRVSLMLRQALGAGPGLQLNGSYCQEVVLYSYGKNISH